jgi:hypothetical protein
MSNRTEVILPTLDRPEIDQAVEDAAQAACEILDKQFPGWDNGGITSNFQGLLADHIRAMLKGNPFHDRRHGVPLPTLVEGDIM